MDLIWFIITRDDGFRGSFSFIQSSSSDMSLDSVLEQEVMRRRKTHMECNEMRREEEENEKDWNMYFVVCNVSFSFCDVMRALHVLLLTSWQHISSLSSHSFSSSSQRQTKESCVYRHESKGQTVSHSQLQQGRPRSQRTLRVKKEENSWCQRRDGLWSLRWWSQEARNICLFVSQARKRATKPPKRKKPAAQKQKKWTRHERGDQISLEILSSRESIVSPQDSIYYMKGRCASSPSSQRNLDGDHRLTGSSTDVITVDHRQGPLIE
jgi:hypothetical protein